MIKWLSFLKQRLKILKLGILSLFWNSYLSWNYVSDTLLQPMIWFVDHYLNILGPTFIIIIAYLIGVPYYWYTNPHILLILLLIGNWLKINVVYHFYKAIKCNPGYPPDSILPQAVTICRKCISPKPPRSHHCSICNRCILKMDHHCCYKNHYHFFLLIVYSWFGTLFLVLFGGRLAFKEINQSYCNNNFYIVNWYLQINNQCWYHNSIIIAFILSIRSFLLWQCWLISHNETSIERHINKAQKFQNKNFINPYNLGFKENWKQFLGLNFGIIHVLFPLECPHLGDGLNWPCKVLKIKHNNN